MLRRRARERRRRPEEWPSRIRSELLRGGDCQNGIQDVSGHHFRAGIRQEFGDAGRELPAQVRGVAVAGHVQTENFRARQDAVEHGGIAEQAAVGVAAGQGNQDAPERKHGLIVSTVSGETIVHGHPNRGGS